MPSSPAQEPPESTEALPREGSVQSHIARPEPQKATLGPLGVKVSGSASKGHHVAMREDALAKIFGTDEPYQVNGLLSHCLKVLHGSEAGDASDERTFMLSAIKDLAPRDAVERMLAVQMTATHVAMIRAGRSMATCTLLPQLEAHSTNFNKLGRTFTAQMEALRKHRTGGKQSVTVEHVHVHPGGQAIVGDVHHGGRGAADEK